MPFYDLRDEEDRKNYSSYMGKKTNKKELAKYSAPMMNMQSWSPKTKIPGMSDFKFSYTPYEPYKAKEISGALPEYDLLREKVEQRAREQGQEASSAIRRRFAAMGGLQTGAAIKSEQKAVNKAQQIATGELSNIDVAEATEKRRRQEVEEGKEYQSAEQLKARGFQSQMTENQLKQQWATNMTNMGLQLDQMELDKMIAEFNMMIAKNEQNSNNGSGGTIWSFLGF